ncbi:hypothetical protein BD413DRAFT_605716 [Trametes elegans]|nr:hypothetical protein BD413DRAFT_605716 [Trametes elegans]
MASRKLRDIAPKSLPSPPLPPPPPPPPDPVKDTLTRLGLTEEQFKAKQSEMMRVLLDNQPFVPKKAPSSRRELATASRTVYHRSDMSSTSSSRGPSPAPHTPGRNFADLRPRDQMELIIERHNREHAPQTPHHYRYYSERVVGEASGSRVTLDHHVGPATPSTGRGRGQFKMPQPPFSLPQTPSNPIHPSPGPYSARKPDLSYAAIIGQAILASPGHALALQDIYEYITTVYPFYKRGEPTWMNSVRHALSTMAVFRKVQRDRSEGKSLWAIWDRDLPCFEGGGFKKSLCAEMRSTSQSSRTTKKRGIDEGGGPRTKRKKTGVEPIEEDQGSQPIMAPAPMLPPFFPHVAAPSPYHQPYYMAACAQQQVPAEVLFPPLPPSSNYHRIIERAASSTLDSDDAEPTLFHPAPDEIDSALSSSPVERPPSSSSLPELVPCQSEASSPTSSSQASLPDEGSRDPSPLVATGPPHFMRGPVEDPDAPWLQSDVLAPTPPARALAAEPSKKDKGKARADGSTIKKRSQVRVRNPRATGRYGFRSPRRKATRGSPAQVNSPKAVPSGAKIPAITAGTIVPPSMTASVEEILRAMGEHAESGEFARESSPSALSEVEVATMVTSTIGVSEPSTPEVASSVPLPMTPTQRLEDLEAELFDFSPIQTPQMRPLSKRGPSPAMGAGPSSSSLYTPRAPYLTAGNVEELLSGEPGASTAHAPHAPPRTPKKTPPKSSSFSPYGTPSRGIHTSFDDDIAGFFQSPGGSSLFEPFLPNLSRSPVLYGLQSPGFGGQY